ncbi:two-component sensor histidine kinase, partial [Streptomyces sp. NPDC007896]
MTRRLLLSYLGLALLVLAGLEIPLGYLYARGEESRFSQSVERDASMLAEVAEENIEKGNTAELPRLAGEYAAETGGRVVVVDRQGAVLVDSAGRIAAGTDLSGEPDIATALRNRRTVATRTDTDGTDLLTATLPGASGTT